jgi:putative ABC transport system permease protein
MPGDHPYAPSHRAPWPVGDPQLLTTLLASTLGRPRLLAWLLTTFAASGLLLSLVGLYGVVALHVRQRQREIGIRLALGATAGGVARRVVGEGLRHTGIGLAMGVPAAFLLSGGMESLLFGVTAHDAFTFVLLPVLLVAAAASASYAPARRAARVDPAAMLRDADA